MKLFLSNSLEVLADFWRDQLLQAPNPSFFEPEVVVVPHPLMGQWVSLSMAKRLGFWGNIVYFSPNQILHQWAQHHFPQYIGQETFQPHILCWKIMRWFGEPSHFSEFPELESFLNIDSSWSRRFQFSQQVALCLENYWFERPEMIRTWESEQKSTLSYQWKTEELWQKAIWQFIHQESPSLHQIIDGILSQKTKISNEPWPSRVSVFGVSTLSPWHLNLLQLISNTSDVALYALSPCQEYWGHLVSQKNIAKYQDLALPTSFTFEEGHPLLASLGMVGRDFLNHLLSLDFHEEQSEYVRPPSSSLLHQLQTNILELYQPLETQSIDASDTSLQIHDCPSIAREIQILHDHILHWLSEDPALEPHEVLVMAPQIETYIPWIDAIFSQSDSASLPLSYQILSPEKKRGDSVPKAFFQWIDGGHERFTAPGVLDLLALPPFQKKMGLAATDFPKLHYWIEEVAIRWGRDAAHRQQLGLPATAENTWRSGLQQLLWGYALSGEGSSLWNGEILPYEEVEGSDRLLLGTLIEWVETLFALETACHKHRSLQEWRDFLIQTIHDLFTQEDLNLEEGIALLRAVNELVVIQQATLFEQKIPLELIQTFLKESLEISFPMHAWGSGGVTFGSIHLINKIPFKIIAMIGMNDGAYPHSSRRPPFDLIQCFPKKGDRPQRWMDRYRFLQVLVSAKNKLFMSYVGRDPQQHPQSPSVLVSELKDHLEKTFCAPDGNLLKTVFFQHPFLDSDPIYFQKTSIFFSHSSSAYAAAAANIQAQNDTPVFWQAPLPAPEKEWKTVSLKQLLSFWRHPARYFFRQRLDLFYEDPPLLEVHEPLIVQGLERYQLRHWILESILKGIPPQQGYEVAKAKGILPHGVAGKSCYFSTLSGLRPLVQQIQLKTTASPIEPLKFNLELGPFQIQGTLSNLYPEGMLRYKSSSIRARDQLGFWIEHLLLNAVAPPEVSKTTWIFEPPTPEQPNGCVWNPIPKAALFLEKLLDFYWQGLSEPLCFFPETSKAYAERFLKTRDHPSALQTALRHWQTSHFYPGESEDWYFKQAFSGQDPFESNFDTLAIDVFQPLLEF